MNAPETLETARLLLRKPVGSDAEVIFRRYAADPEVTRYLSWPTHRAIEGTMGFLSWSDSEWRQWPAGPYLIFAKERPFETLLGATGLAFQSPTLAATGYVLAQDAWGHGYATEALQAMVEVARKTGVKRLEAVCHADHRASAHVMEKCGFLQQKSQGELLAFPNITPVRPAAILTYAVIL